MDTPTQLALSLLEPPYRYLRPAGPDWTALRPQGRALVWNMGTGQWKSTFEICRTRPPGLPLIVVLPPAVEISNAPEVLRVVEQCRPHSILPHHAEPHVDDLRAVLRRTPTDLGMEVMEYIQWRGINVDLQTRHLIRKTIALSVEVRTVSGLSRKCYLSRRALGRRFLTRGIPVPSHWLHFGRILRAILRLQSSDATLMTVAYEMGYSDGFTLSNQMERLTGVRPRQARASLGWEWAVEAWLQSEAESGGLSMTLHRRFRLRPQPTVGPSVPRLVST